MKNITLIYPDGSVHRVVAQSIERYRVNNNSINVLVYEENNETYLTLLAEVGGTICKIPYDSFDLSNAELVGSITPEKLPSVILSAVLLEPGQEMDGAYQQLQEISNQAEAEGQWFSEPEVHTSVALSYPFYSTREVKYVEKPIHEHFLYTTYYFSPGELEPLAGNQVTYEHIWNLIRINGQAEFAFKKPLLFSEVNNEISRIISEEKPTSLLDEIPTKIVDMPVEPGTTVADYIVQPDGRVQVALALAIPGIHRYYVTFGKCPDKSVYLDAAKFENSEFRVLEEEYNGVGTEYAFRGGMIGILPIRIGDKRYESLYKSELQESRREIKR